MDVNLKQLEAESIHILRETAAVFRNPAVLYSIGKGSSVLLHLALKACAPSKPPFTFLHIDTGWKFREMIAFRDSTMRDLGLRLVVRMSEEARHNGITPFSHGSVNYTDIAKTQVLRAALDEGGYDAAVGGARRDEEASRSKERMFPVRSPNHRWDPRRQRPELWRVYNGRLIDQDRPAAMERKKQEGYF